MTLSAGASPLHAVEDEESMDTAESSSSSRHGDLFDPEQLSDLVVPRYTYQHTTIESYVLEVIIVILMGRYL